MHDHAPQPTFVLVRPQMGENIGAGRWSLRLQYKPLLRFLWLGALIMAFGGIIASADRRYREASARAAAAVPPANALANGVS